jgi:hypothetical protein
MTKSNMKQPLVRYACQSDMNYFKNVYIPNYGDKFYLPDPLSTTDEFIEENWLNDFINSYWLLSNLVFLNKRDVKKATKFILDYVKKNKTKLGYINIEPHKREILYVSSITDIQRYTICSYAKNGRPWANNPLNGFLYEKKDDAVRASNLIINALSSELFKQTYKYINEVPEDGTVLYTPNISTIKGYDKIIFNKKDNVHQYLLTNHLLYPSLQHAKYAKENIMKSINPFSTITV